MNRTVAYFVAAGALALVAVLVTAPKPGVPLPFNAGPIAPTTTAGDTIKMVGRLSHPYVMPGNSELFVTVDLTGAEVPGAARSPVNLAVVIDRSGSMIGYKLDQAKNAARRLIEQLRDSDRLAIVHYGSDVKVLPSLYATAANRENMTSFVSAIFDDGGTNIGAGLTEARAQIERTRSDFKVNRVILISDGQPTEGLTDASALTQLARGIKDLGIAVSAVGVGEDFSEDLMQGIAEYGAGSYGFLRDAGALANLFSRDLQRAGTQVAKNVELSFELPSGVELGEVLGYRSTVSGRTVRVPVADFSAGQLERVVARLRVTAPGKGSAFDVTGLRLAYLDLTKDQQVSVGATLSARVTEVRDEMLAKRDKDATVFATRAQKAENIQRAAQALSSGDRAGAARYMRRNAPLLQEAKALAGSAALADDFKEQDEISAGMDAAASPEAINVQVKAAKSSSRKGFGKIGSTY
ncbi:MAG: vWA domain-containing protein [Myxococcaceae bacterium]